ncbi:hypothetical protein AGMMS49991_02440 [Spirochaetia bacterium]|nr:hypothetical protein AGMMS49991_02440 [Spirochaetia bacterium]
MTENLFTAPGTEALRLMEGLPGLIDKTFPIPKQFRSGLKHDVAELSRLLTSARGDLKEGYLGQAPMVSAYLRYFLPWNVYRLSRLLPGLPLELADGDTVTDLGSGPLTFPVALWISRPDLRAVKLEFRCIDRTGPILDAGKKLFTALAGAGSPWTIRTIRGELHGRRGDVRASGGTRSSKNSSTEGTPGLSPAVKSGAALVSAVNVYNEIFRDIPYSDSRSLVKIAEREARFLSDSVGPAGAILVVEPGVPRSGEFIAALRAALSGMGRQTVAPCPHSGECPFPGGNHHALLKRNTSGQRDDSTNRAGAGGKEKWCHFAFDTDDAPAKLHSLSAAAGIPKERAALSFLLAGGAMPGAPVATKGNGGGLRVNDSIPGTPVSGRDSVAVKANTNKPRVTDDLTAAHDNRIAVRVISDAFPVHNMSGSQTDRTTRFGRYACSAAGSVLITGSAEEMASTPAGTLLRLALPDREKRDPKSGALVLEPFAALPL